MVMVKLLLLDKICLAAATRIVTFAINLSMEVEGFGFQFTVIG